MVKKTGRSSDFSVTLKHDDIDQACQLLRSSACNDVNSVASIPGDRPELSKSLWMLRLNNWELKFGQ